jgi:hypothetical protein
VERNLTFISGTGHPSPLNVVLHRLKGKHCPIQMQAQAFKYEKNTSHQQLYWDLMAC